LIFVIYKFINLILEFFIPIEKCFLYTFVGTAPMSGSLSLIVKEKHFCPDENVVPSITLDTLDHLSLVNLMEFLLRV
jgi:hypothetical protein